MTSSLNSLPKSVNVYPQTDLKCHSWQGLSRPVVGLPSSKDSAHLIGLPNWKVSTKTDKWKLDRRKLFNHTAEAIIGSGINPIDFICKVFCKLGSSILPWVRQPSPILQRCSDDGTLWVSSPWLWSTFCVCLYWAVRSGCCLKGLGIVKHCQASKSGLRGAWLGRQSILQAAQGLHEPGRVFHYSLSGAQQTLPPKQNSMWAASWYSATLNNNWPL